MVLGARTAPRDRAVSDAAPEHPPSPPTHPVQPAGGVALEGQAQEEEGVGEALDAEADGAVPHVRSPRLRHGVVVAVDDLVEVPRHDLRGGPWHLGSPEPMQSPEQGPPEPMRSPWPLRSSGSPESLDPHAVAAPHGAIGAGSLPGGVEVARVMALPQPARPPKRMIRGRTQWSTASQCDGGGGQEAASRACFDAALDQPNAPRFPAHSAQSHNKMLA